MKIAIGGDHAGYELKEVVVRYLEEKGIEIIDKGPFATDSVDYPDFVHPVCQELITQAVDMAILICGSGNGVAITANKYAKVRCGLCWTAELAALTVQHNNANAIAIPARFIETETALEIVEAFLDNQFEGGRHQRRVDKINPDAPNMC